MLTFCSLSNLRYHKSPINFLAVRYQLSEVNGVLHLPQLSPSPRLFSILKSCKTEEEFNNNRSKFRKEMETCEGKAAIQTIKELLDLGQDITVSCYCGNFELCHTKFLAEIFEEAGYEVSVH